MYRMNRNSEPVIRLRRRTTLAAAVAALALSAGCGDDQAEHVEAPANEPAAQPEASAPPQAPDPCEIPQDLIAEQPWAVNFPC